MGHSIEITHSCQIVYTEDDRSMAIDIDLRDPVPCLYKSAISKWLPLHELDAVSDEKKEEIIARVRDYLLDERRWAGLEVDRTA